jgi:hypothetical protein
MRLYPVGKFHLAFPDTHALFEIQRLHTHYDRAFGPVVEAIARRAPNGVFIDIGANVGDTAAMFATHAPNPVVCVEGNSTFLPYLQANAPLLPKAEVVASFVGLLPDQSAERGYVSLGEVIRIAERDNRSIALLKTDTDGWDAAILEQYTAQRETPLFFEFDPICTVGTGGRSAHRQWLDLLQRLQEQAYSAIVFDNYGLPMSCFDRLPASHLMELSSYCRLQAMVGMRRVYYLDIWAFPKSWHGEYKAAATAVRRTFLNADGT